MKKEYNTIPSHGEIYDYWKTKVITKDFKIVDYIDFPEVEGETVINDWGEPECWCCGDFVKTIYKHKNYEDNLETNDGIKKIWNYKEVASKLNRCHIKPKALGGSFHPSNLFLLCEECHSKSPDTNNPKIFFEWILRHRKIDSKCFFGGYSQTEITDLIKEINGMCTGFNINITDLTNYISNNINNKEIQKFLSNNINSHGKEIVISSYIGGWIDYYINDKNNEVSLC